MASENVENWELPLPSSETYSEELEEEEECLTYEDRMLMEKEKKLECYVCKMAYRPFPPPKLTSRELNKSFKKLSQPTKRNIVSTYEQHAEVLTPKLRRKRVEQLAGKYTAITAEQFERIMKSQKSKEDKKANMMKEKQEIFYQLLTKLEQQCRTQYLNVLLKKFASFMAKLATTMQIPKELIEPYGRMQRGIFCNILLAIGVQPTHEAAMFYTNKHAVEYAVCHRLAHAILSLIIKALDSASMKKADDIQPIETKFEMDNYIKDRLMCAAEKKVKNAHRKKKEAAACYIPASFKKCGYNGLY